MKKAALLESPKRGVHKITKRGLEVLRKNPSNESTWPTSVNSRSSRTSEPRVYIKQEATEQEFDLNEKTPKESLESAYQKLRDDLASDLLQQLKACSPAFFERLVVDAIVKMGYGGTRQDAGKAIGAAGDGGIDGIIKEDKLGLDTIYIQAKRWENTVGRPEIQKFIGALAQQRAKKGLFITTSSFSADAEDCVSRIDANEDLRIHPV